MTGMGGGVRGHGLNIVRNYFSLFVFVNTTEFKEKKLTSLNVK